MLQPRILALILILTSKGIESNEGENAGVSQGVELNPGEAIKNGPEVPVGGITDMNEADSDLEKNSLKPRVQKERPINRMMKKAIYKKAPLNKKGFRVWEDDDLDEIVVKEKTLSFNFILMPRTHDCFYLEVEGGLNANIEYSVRSVNKNDGSYNTVTATLFGSDHSEEIDRFEGQRSGFFQYQADSSHDIKICFIHPGGNQQLVVFLDIITLKSSVESKKEVNAGGQALDKIELNLFRSFHQVFLIKTRISLDIEHIKAVSDMVDYRSCIYIIMVACVSLAQIAVHRHYFTKNSKHGV